MRLLNYSFIVLLPLIPAGALWWYFGEFNQATLINQQIRAVGPIAGYLATMIISFAFFTRSHSDRTQRILDADKRQRRMIADLCGKWIYNDTFHRIQKDGSTEQVSTTGHAEIAMLPEGSLAMTGSWRDQNDVLQSHWRSDDVMVGTRRMRVLYSVPAMHGSAPRSGVMTLQFLSNEDQKVIALEGDYAILGLQAYGTVKFKRNGL